MSSIPVIDISYICDIFITLRAAEGCKIARRHVKWSGWRLVVAGYLTGFATLAILCSDVYFVVQRANSCALGGERTWTDGAKGDAIDREQPKANLAVRPWTGENCLAALAPKRGG
jgi:hypothetical protein